MKFSKHKKPQEKPTLLHAEKSTMQQPQEEFIQDQSVPSRPASPEESAAERKREEEEKKRSGKK